MMFVRPIPTVLSALGLLLLTGCGTSSAIQESRDYARLADFQHAYEVLAVARQRQLADGGTVDPDLEREYQEVRLKFLRDRAMKRIFAEREDAALLDLELLADADPDYPKLDVLRKMALRKKALRVVRHADENFRERDLVEALRGYLRAQQLVPGLVEANEGVVAVRREIDRLDERARGQFLQAVRKVPEFRHAEVAWHAASVVSTTPDPEDDKVAEAERLRSEARARRAEEVMQRGLACEREDKFGAALVYYREVLRLAPGHEAATESIARMHVELSALALIERARMELRNDNFQLSKALLDEAFDLSTLLRGQISELMIQVRKERVAAAYQAALDLEVLGKKAEALAAFEQLAEDNPEGVKDEQVRIESLRVDIEGASQEWQAALEAEQAGRLEDALDHYVNAERFYPLWREGEKEIERLRRVLAERKAAEAGGGDGS